MSQYTPYKNLRSKIITKKYIEIHHVHIKNMSLKKKILQKSQMILGDEKQFEV